ncbi:MAG TPA: PIG-L deacetylase family protein [Trueperaceae bacterium]
MTTAPTTRTLLAIFAHPDDEAFGTGGTLAHYAALGYRVRLLCATRGESGKITDPEITADADLAEVREAELQAACLALGIDAPVFLGFHDSGRQERTRHDDPRALMNVDELELERAILPHISKFLPEVVITFDPHGIYGHVDHIKIHRAATAAFWSAGNVAAVPPRRLFYTAMAAGRLREMQAARQNSPMSGLDPDLYGVSEGSFAAVLDVSAQLEAKQQAIRAHRSQTGPRSSFANMPAEAWQQALSRETFTLGGLRDACFPTPPVGDLFAGL